MEQELHELEQEFGLPAREILDVINNRNRCKIAVRGAIAEAHLIRVLRELTRTGRIDGFKDFDRDGYPDCQVELNGHSFLIECKNVEKPKWKAGRENEPVSIDFQRTRAPIDKKWERYYLPSEFDVLAACLWNRTGRWEFRYAATNQLARHPLYPDRLATVQKVEFGPNEVWTRDLPGLLHTLTQLV